MKKPKRIFAKINKEKQKEQIKRVMKQLLGDNIKIIEVEPKKEVKK